MVFFKFYFFEAFTIWVSPWARTHFSKNQPAAILLLALPIMALEKRAALCYHQAAPRP
jgi:hypothetical protein